MANVMRLVFRTIFKPWRAVAWTRTTPGQVCIGIYRALPLSRVKYTWSVGLNAQNRRVEISGKSFNKWRDLKNRELIWKPNSSPTTAIGARWQSRPIIAGCIIVNADSLSRKYTTCNSTQFSTSAFSEDTGTTFVWLAKGKGGNRGVCFMSTRNYRDSSSFVLDHETKHCTRRPVCFMRETKHLLDEERQGVCLE